MKGDLYSTESSNDFLNLKSGTIIKLTENPNNRFDDRGGTLLVKTYRQYANVIAINIKDGTGWTAKGIDEFEFEVIIER